MPGATLIIEGPDGERHEIAIEQLGLSDSRAQMAELTKIAKSLDLPEDSTEEQILAKLSEKPDPTLDAEKVAKALGIDKADEASIVAKAAELAEVKPLADGDVAVKKADLNQLTADAAKGAKAADELKQSKFDVAFQKALDEVRIDAKDETKVRLQKLYDVAPDETLADLDARPKLVNTEAHGHGDKPGEAPEGTDPERFDLDEAAKTKMVEDKIDYETAINRVLADRSRS
jgi:hypothetical protein